MTSPLPTNPADNAVRAGAPFAASESTSMAMHVAVTGSSGLIGRALVERLRTAGHRVTPLRRGAGSNQQPAWDPPAGWIAPGALEGCDVVVHLAGASIGEGRWTAARRRELSTSRIDATRLLVDHLASLRSPPCALISASAVGYYGDRGDEPLDETAGRGGGFLADLVAGWEGEALAAERLGLRVAMPRFGVVLARHGGALPRMILSVRVGAGGPLGNGRQWMPWVTLHDAARALEFLVTREVRGAFNVTAPEPARNVDFIRAMARQMHRPALLPTPAFALRLLLGRAADELLLASARVAPDRLLEAGFTFDHPTLDLALPAALHDAAVVHAGEASVP